MLQHMYWISTLTYSAVLLIILINDILIKKKTNAVGRSFRLMTGWMLFFCIQDTFWGLCSAGIIKSDALFFAFSTLFHASTVVTTFFWLNYILLYAGQKIKKREFYLAFDGLVILCEFILVTINLFKPVLFSVENGIYNPGPLRPLTFINQYIVYLLICAFSGYFAASESGKSRKRYITVVLSSAAPVLMGVFQLLYPDAPFYSLGYFLTAFIIHMFVVTKDREEASRTSVLRSIASTYYSMHLIDMETRTIERYIESDILKNLIGKSTDAQEMINNSFNGSVCEEYLQSVLDFVNLDTLNERMKDKNIISMEFVGTHFGWTRVNLISVEQNEGEQKRVMLTTQVIDEEKKNQMDLLFRSNNDELTSLYNRRAFEDDIKELSSSSTSENIIFAALDVNELKVANDTLGHEAGDELLTGAANLMRMAFGTYGKIYRTGGDEFYAILKTDSSNLDKIRTEFGRSVDSWRGKHIEKLSVSCGYVSKDELKIPSVREMMKIADQRMYDAKAEHYRSKGFDRRGQRDAHAALSSLYIKILKINITGDSYQIVNIPESEKTAAKGFSDSLSEWIRNFVASGQVHPEDTEHFLEKTDTAYLSSYFKENESSLRIRYRRISDSVFKNAVTEIVRANDYSDEVQTLFLYVKLIDE